jgi:hypothetical protein
MLGIIGSTALIDYIDIGRTPVDFDIVGEYDEIISYMKLCKCDLIYPIDAGKKLVGKGHGRIIEAEIAWPGSTSEELLQLIANEPNTDNNDFINEFDRKSASLDLLYLLKMTHRFRKNSPHFLKTMRDIHLMREAGAVIRPEHEEFYKRRLKETLDYKHPKLNQNKKQFFTDDVPYVYDHDTIHQAIKLYDKPAYEFYKKDAAEVECSKEMFFQIDNKYRLAGVYEEACVLALERSQIPYPETDRKKSFDMALMKVCTSITSGWFREYAWENYLKVQDLYYMMTMAKENYVDVFNKGLEAGVVKPHKI